jgi:hypothetical protein
MVLDWKPKVDFLDDIKLLEQFSSYIEKEDIFIGLGSDLFADNSLFIHPTHEIMLDTEFAR